MNFTFAPVVTNAIPFEDLVSGETFVLQDDVSGDSGNLGTAKPDIYLVLDTGSAVNLSGDGYTEEFGNDTQVYRVNVGSAPVTVG